MINKISKFFLLALKCDIILYCFVLVTLIVHNFYGIRFKCLKRKGMKLIFWKIALNHLFSRID